MLYGFKKSIKVILLLLLSSCGTDTVLVVDNTAPSPEPSEEFSCNEEEIQELEELWKEIKKQLKQCKKESN